MMTIYLRGNSFHVNFCKDGERLRGSLGTSSRTAGLNRIHRLEIALSEGSRSTEWPELSAVLPRRTYLEFARLVGVTETKLYTWGDLCESFRARNEYRITIDTLRDTTADRYAAVMREFDVFLKEPERKISLLRDIDKPLIKKYKFWRIKRIEQQGGMGKGVVTDIGVLHTAFQHAVEEGMIASNPVQLEKSNRGENSEGGAVPFTGNELARLRRHAGEDLTMVLLLRHTGLRKSDAVSVCFREVDFDKKKLNRVTRKRRKRVILSLHPELMAALSAEYQRRNASPNDPILLNPNTGEPFTAASLYDHVVALGKRAGVPHAHPHRFRATYAVDLLYRGTGTYHVAQALGDTEKIVIKHYTRFIPELGEQLRSFVENGQGFDEEPPEVFLERIAQHGQRSGSCEPHESLKPESACTSDIPGCRATRSDAVAAAPQTAQPGGHPSVAIVCQTRKEDGKNSPGPNADSDAKRSSVAAKPDRGAVFHGTRTAYDRYGCRCELCKAASSEHMKKYRAGLKAKGTEPMVTLTCPECGKEFLRPKRNSPAAKGTKNAYCSQTCSWKAAAKRGGVVVHGTRRAYDKHGCRCEPCRAVHSEHLRKCRAATAKRKSQEPTTQVTNYEEQVPCQGIEREGTNEQSCA